MTSNCSVNSQVTNLLSQLSQLLNRGTHHLNEVESDLAQTRSLLIRAVESLGASFLALHAAAVAQQQSIDRLLAGAKPTVALAATLEQARREIERHANATVTGLQFQDLTNQLIDRTAGRVTGLRELLGGFGAGGETLPRDASEAATIEALADLIAAAEGRIAALDLDMSKSVSQTHMDSGDVELF
jgi:hypothetical protein